MGDYYRSFEFVPLRTRGDVLIRVTDVISPLDSPLDRAHYDREGVEPIFVVTPESDISLVKWGSLWFVQRG